MRVTSSGSNLGTANGPFTVSAWIEQGADTGGANLIARGSSGDHWALEGYYFQFIPFRTVAEVFSYGNGSASGSLSADAGGFGGWASTYDGPLTLFTIVFTGTQMQLYINGNSTPAQQSTTIDLNNANDLVFGLNSVFYDEIRLGDFAMSPAAIKLAYENQRPSGQSLVTAQ